MAGPVSGVSLVVVSQQLFVWWVRGSLDGLSDSLFRRHGGLVNNPSHSEVVWISPMGCFSSLLPHVDLYSRTYLSTILVL